MASVYFHEDEYCRVEVLPVGNLAHLLAEMGRIDEFAAAHSEPGGFTDMYVRGDAPQPLSSLGITLADLQAALDPLLTPFAEVYTGYSTYRERCVSTVAWGVSLLAAGGRTGDRGLV